MEVVAIPRRPTEAEVLALVSRVRQARVDAGQIDESRLFDLRVFKCVSAELAYFRRLAYAQVPSAHVATSMPQLVKGLARLHPRWTMTGDAFADRDRHHSAVRRRLGVMAACGLLTWQAGVNLEGEESRTELLLLDVPAIAAEELKAARAQLRRWRRQNGHSLNTGSSTGIRNATRAAADLSRSECQMRARNRAQRLRAACVRGKRLEGKTAPPFGTAFAFGEQQNSERPADYVGKDATTAPTTNHEGDTSACGLTRGARQARASSFNCIPGAVEGPGNSSIEGEGRQRIGDLGAVADDLRAAEVVRRARASLEQAQDISALLGADLERRVVELSGSDADRGWPAGRVVEAWLLATLGVDRAVGAVRRGDRFLSPGRLRQLHQAVRRYERYAAVDPGDWPAGGWAAFLHAAATWQEHALPAGTVVAFDQLTLRMRAREGVAIEMWERLRRQKARAHKRRYGSPPAAPEIAELRRFVFRTEPRRAASPWEPWVILDETGTPVILTEQDETGGLSERLAVDREHLALPPAGSRRRREVERDALLLHGRLPLGPEHDGRQTRLLPADEKPGPPPTQEERDARELAHRYAMSLRSAQRIAPELREQMLQTARARDRRDQAAERPPDELAGGPRPTCEQLRQQPEDPWPPMSPEAP